MRNSKAIFGINLVPVFALAVMFLLPSALVGQEGRSEAQSGPLEGMWRMQVTVRDCQTGVTQRTFPALFAFDKGGIVTATTGGLPPAISTPQYGVWRHTDGHNYSAVVETFIFNPVGVWTQTYRFTHAIELDKDADAFTDTIKLEIFDTTGSLIVTGCGGSVAQRFEMP